MVGDFSKFLDSGGNVFVHGVVIVEIVRLV